MSAQSGLEEGVSPRTRLTFRLGRYVVQVCCRVFRLTRPKRLDPWEERDRIGMLNREIEEAHRFKEDWWW